MSRTIHVTAHGDGIQRANKALRAITTAAEKCKCGGETAALQRRRAVEEATWASLYIDLLEGERDRLKAATPPGRIW